ncbi:hypothetical protein J6590_107064, partial [Homalodisca vitripennis]
AKDVDDLHISGVGYVILLPQVSATTKSRERPRAAVTRSDQPAFDSPPDSKKQPVTQHNPPPTTV